MNEQIQDGRHLTFSTLDQLWSSGTPMVLPVGGEPACSLRLDPTVGTITLVTAYEDPEPDVAKLKNITFDPVAEGGEELAELSIRVERNIHGAYGLLASIADELQLKGTPLAAAVAAGVDRYRDVLTGRSGLTPQEEVGLVGELLFLEFVIRQIGVGPAVNAWQGPLSEEHDFTFAASHVEVKTTSGESRKHIINSLEQLVPLNNIPLYLLSIQITRSSPDGGRSLPQLVTAVKKNAGPHQVNIDGRLEFMGWRPEDADLYPTPWTLRTQPRAYAVDGKFPAIVRDRIRTAIPNSALVDDVSYTLDLTSFGYMDLPDPLVGFAEKKES